MALSTPGYDLATWEVGWLIAVGVLVLAVSLVGGWLWARKLRADRRNLETQVADRTRHLAALNAVATAASQSLHREVILTSALDETLAVTGLEAGGIYLLQPDGQHLTIAAQRGLDEPLVQAVDHLAVGEGFSGRVFQTGEPTVVRNLGADPRLTRPAVREAGFQTVAIVPLTTRGRTLGTMFLMTRRGREFSPWEMELLGFTGRQIGLAIENARLFETEERRAEQFKAISEVGRHIASVLNLDELLAQIAASVRDAFDFYLVEIGLVEGETLVFTARADRSGEPLSQTFRLKIEQESSITGAVAATGKPLLVPDVRREPRFVLVSHPATLSELAMPIKVKDRVIGVINVQSDRLGAFDEDTLAVLGQVANQAATAIENARLFAQEQRRAEQFRVIAEVGRRLALTLDINNLLRQVVELIRQALGYYHVGIGLIEGDEVVYRVGAGELWDDPHFQFKPSHLRVGTEGLTGWVAGHGEPLLVPDVSREPRYVWMQGSRTQSELLVPITAKGQTIGVLDVQSDCLNTFDEEDVNTLQSLANQVGAAIENAHMYAAEQRRAEQFRVLTEVNRHITSWASVDEILEQIASLVQTSFGYTHVGIGLVEGSEVVSKAEAGAFVNHYRAARIPLGQSSWGWVAEHGEALRSSDLQQEGLDHHPHPAGQIRSHLCVPLKMKGQVIGVLSAASDRVNAFDDSDETILQSLANQASTAIENARLYAQAQQLAISEERSRLARDLHDSVTQALYGITLYSRAAADHLAAGRTDIAAEHLRELRDTSLDALAEMRLLIFELRPPILAEEGLVAALQARLLAVEGRAGLKTEFKAEMQGRLPLTVEEGLYRIAQEALNNCLKHAGAHRVVVKVWREDQRVTVTIADDGVGFDPATARERGGLGLSAMAERAAQLGGRLSVNSKPGEGTQVRMEVL